MPRFFSEEWYVFSKRVRKVWASVPWAMTAETRLLIFEELAEGPQAVGLFLDVQARRADRGRATHG